MKKLLPLFIFLFIGGSVFSQTMVSLTVNLNMANETVDPGGVYLAGGTGFGVAGDNEMLDPDMDGIYSITMMLPQGFSSHYTFLNGNCPGWGCKENIAGLTCADANNFNDRLLSPLQTDSTINTCFAQCTTDGSCMSVDPPVNVTFNVDMNGQTVDAGGVFIGANFDGWSGGLQMDDSDMDGVYSYTASLAAGDYEFKYINGPSWAIQEDFDPTTNDSTCTLTTGGFTNRLITVGTSDMIIPTICWDSCFTCAVDTMNNSVGSLLDLSTEMKAYHNSETQELTVSLTSSTTEPFDFYVIDIMGKTQVIERVAPGAQSFNVSTVGLAQGLYFLRMENAKIRMTQKAFIRR